ncbi:MAG: sigma-54-dependent transcriptional regulator [Planctomycetota bacterium]
MTRILVTDDDSSMREVCQRHLANAGYEVKVAANAKEGVELFSTFKPELALLDLKMPDRSGQEVLATFQEMSPATPVIIITAFNDARMAVDLLKAGARDYLVKPFPKEELLHAVRAQLEVDQLRAENAALRSALTSHESEPPPVAESPASRALMESLRLAAVSQAPLVLVGPSGSGKRHWARWVHRQSLRRGQPLVEVSLQSLSPELSTSELFGHRKGAFTGATEDAQGYLRQAHEGTLVLSGIEECPMDLQGKLLRVLETRTVRPLGAVQDEPADFRLITLAKTDLASLVKQGTLREDLFFRIQVVSLEVPGLDKRREDIWPLTLHLAALHGRTPSPASRKKLESHGWAGNIRELRNLVEKSSALSTSGLLELDPRVPTLDTAPENLTLDSVTKVHVKAVLAHCGGNKSQAAKLLGISRRTLYAYLGEPEENA